MAEEGTWYEVAEWRELIDSEEKTFEKGDLRTNFKIKGPLDKVMVVEVDDAWLDGVGDYFDQSRVCEAILDRAKKALEQAGWEHPVILLPSNIRLMRLVEMKDD